MSCSDEYVYHDTQNNLINITPSLQAKLRKAKYGVFNHSAVELCHWTKKSFYDEGIAINTNSMVYPLIGVWK